MTSKRHIQAPEVSCIGKDKMTAVVARKVAKKLRNGSANAYRCEHCGHWHIGSHVARPQYHRNAR